MGNSMHVYGEKIESYLTGKLEGVDKVNFESLLKNDVELKAEVDFQNDIVESIRSNRKAQLKDRLNKIDVTAGNTGVSSAVKIAASFITVGILGAGLYYMTVLTPKTVKPNPQITTSEIQPSPKDEASIVIIEETTKSTKNNKSTSRKISPTPNASATYSSTPSNKLKNVVASANAPEGSLVETDVDRLSNEISVPLGEVGESSKLNRSSSVEVNIDDRNQKDFSYKFYGGKLFLYGDFTSQPYDLLEVNTVSKVKRFFLKVDSSYYELNSNQTKSTRLREVKDASILENLNK